MGPAGRRTLSYHVAIPALFARFPALAGQVPHHPFLLGPTPIERFGAAGLPPGRVFIKRDERCTPAYGGNKPRKLEFVIGAALAGSAKRLVTSGGLGTHHGLATTILGRSAGLATTLLLVDQPVTDEVRASLRHFSAWGAEVVDGRHVLGAAAGGVRVLLRSMVRGERPCLVPTGGSNPTGTLGAVSAGLELAAQVEAGALPEPAELFVAVGSGGTLAGALVGLRLAGLATRMRGVLVTDILPPSPRGLSRLARRTLARLRRLDATVPDVPISAADFPLVTRQLGAGYGAPTEAAREAKEVAAAAGVELETTYTSKCLSEILVRARSGELPREPVVFWNTFNSVDFSAHAPGPPRPEGLPPRLRRIARL
jgi:D-cysteine desulfhydrase